MRTNDYFPRWPSLIYGQLRPPMERRLHRLSLAQVARGLLIAPLVPALILIVSRKAGIDALLYAYPIAVLGGLPVVLIYELLGWRELWQYLAGSFLLPFATWTLWMTFATHTPLEEAASFAVRVAALFATGALTFWLLAVRPAREPRAHQGV